MTASLIRSLIRETLLFEEVYGAQAIVYHGTEADPKKLVTALLKDRFSPGEGGGSMYGKGLYTVYDLKGTYTDTGGYGDHIIKLKLNLYGYIIFDPDVALKVYKAPLSIVEQAQKLGLSKEIIKKLEEVKIDRSVFTSDAAFFASKFLKGRVKGIVYTGEEDGRCALVYDPTTAVPIAWKNVKDVSWTSVNKKSIKPALRRSASGDWKEEKYESDPVKLLRRLSKKPVEERIINGDLDISGNEEITSLPSELKVMGSLIMWNSHVREFPENLKVKYSIMMYGTKINTLPKTLKVGEAILGFEGDKSIIPPHLREKLR
jgi:hypothetical protein